MADDDIDLDAMLESALDEGFAVPAAAETGDEDVGDIDLDAMLDEAMVASVLEGGNGDGDVTAEKSRSVATNCPVTARISAVMPLTFFARWVGACDR